MERLLTLAEVADLFRVDERTIRNWIKAGTLTAFKIGGSWRIRPSDIERLFERSK